MARTTKADEVHRLLKDKLDGGAFAPGERLTEHKLASMLGVRRGPVRESLLRLQAEGLLEATGPHRGMRVQQVEDLSREEVIARYQLREVIEGLAARLAAENMTGLQINELRRLEGKVAEQIRRVNRRERVTKAVTFHRYLVAHCGNSLLATIYERYGLFPMLAVSEQLEEAMLAGLRESDRHVSWLKPVVEAITAHDPAAAERAMRRWLRTLTQILTKALR